MPTTLSIPSRKEMELADYKVVDQRPRRDGVDSQAVPCEDDVRHITEYASEIQTSARRLLRNEEDLHWFESGDRFRHYERLAAWHRAEAERDQRIAEERES